LVRILAIAAAGVVALAPAVARADRREDLQQQGEQQAKDGRFADAIESFKQADKIQPRASHACLIALAYTRRELWSQAQLWMATCHQRESATDPLPDWVPLADKQIDERLKTANVAAVTIEVKPAGAKAKFWVSSFAPDEVFEPRTITLPFGTHVIFAKLDGSDAPPRQHTVQITDKAPKRVEIDFDNKPTPPESGSGMPMMVPPETPPAPSNGLSNALIIGGAVAIGAGVAFHVSTIGPRNQMLDANAELEATAMTPADVARWQMKYGPAETRFDRARALTIGFYVVGAGVALTGYLIRNKRSPEAATVGATPLPEGGAFVSVGWTR
jgi:hypothetical protein